MNNIVGLYTTIDDIGNHERHYTIQGLSQAVMQL